MDRVYNKLSTLPLIHLYTCNITKWIIIFPSSRSSTSHTLLASQYLWRKVHQLLLPVLSYQYAFVPASFLSHKSDSEIIQFCHVSIGCTLEKCNLRLILRSFYSIQQLGTQVPDSVQPLYTLLHHCQPHTRKSLTDEHILFFYPLI